MEEVGASFTQNCPQKSVSDAKETTKLAEKE